jgi:hypothetical protein
MTKILAGMTLAGIFSRHFFTLANLFNVTRVE